MVIFLCLMSVGSTYQSGTLNYYQKPCWSIIVINLILLKCYGYVHLFFEEMQKQIIRD